MLLLVLPLLLWSECHNGPSRGYPQSWEAGGPEMISEQMACVALQT